MNEHDYREFSICTHPECNRGYPNFANIKRNICGIHKYPLLYKCFFCMEKSLFPGDQFCSNCGVDISRTKETVAMLSIAPEVNPRGLGHALLDLPKQYHEIFKNEIVEFFPIITTIRKNESRGRLLLDEIFYKNVLDLGDKFGSFIEKFIEENYRYFKKLNS